ncbi:fumarylacetoacetate hydrolase family protein [Antribacter sp. KLBMP9083]|uniref:Fumarylacetoacetate hydrolase family protein n=1 Tax=Antribacter soli TaxID=2910976 RepID=A0AA41QEE0_9MICO|nr:fumarylacetoacetate hydrolase family protein [Antribacter soli]MCF4121086.1 fumarylacetoacetate hydrolase family protein [Antribacter soli]
MTDLAPWALGQLSSDDGSFVGVVVGAAVRDLRADAEHFPGVDLTARTATRGLLETWDTARPVLEHLATERDTGRWHPLDDLRVLAPLQPRQILQAGANYRKHVIDLAVSHADIANGRTEDEVREQTAAMMDARRAEGIPYFFIGLPSAITGPYDDVTLPGYSDRHDWELELAAVIGRETFRVGPEAALDHVAAFVVVNDLTTRDLVFRRDMPEIGTDWFRSKNAPGFLPLGPWLVSSAFVPDPQSVHLTLTLNGQVMQDESAADMLFTVAELVSAASQTTPLLPGDLVLTGSPAGNGAHWGRLLRDGDVMESTITGLGTQRTRVVAEASRA